MGLFEDTTLASDSACKWLHRWTKIHGAELVTDDGAAASAFDELLEQYASASEDGDLAFGEPGDYPSLPGSLPDEAELVLFSGYGWWAFALSHSGALWMGIRSELPELPTRAFAVDPEQLIRLMAAGLTN